MASGIARRFLPLADRVLVQKVKQEAKTASGIYLPDASKQAMLQAKVIAVGAGRTLNDGKVAPCSVKEGDTVVIPEYGGTSVKFDEHEYQIFRDEDLIAVIKN